MALTVTIIDSYVIGDRKEVIADVVFDSSYPLGGEAITAAQLGFSLAVTHVIPGVARDPDTADNAVVLDYDKTAGTLIAFWPNSDSADGPLIEVPAATNLSAYTARIVAKGK